MQVWLGHVLINTSTDHDSTYTVPLLTYSSHYDLLAIAPRTIIAFTYSGATYAASSHQVWMDHVLKAAYLPYISPIPRLYLAYTSPISPGVDGPRAQDGGRRQGAHRQEGGQLAQGTWFGVGLGLGLGLGPGWGLANLTPNPNPNPNPNQGWTHRRRRHPRRRRQGQVPTQGQGQRNGGGLRLLAPARRLPRGQGLVGRDGLRR